MNAFFSYLIRKRRPVFLLFLILGGICAVLTFRVHVNTDMTLYLPLSSEMKQGLDILADEFPGLPLTDSSVRVLFSGLTEEESRAVAAQLEGMPCISSVITTQGKEETPQAGYTLYTLTLPYDYTSKELTSTVSDISDLYSDKNPAISIDDPAGGKVPLPIMAAAVLMIIAILCVTASSWLEPVLFLLCTGLAVVLNMGTNIFLGSVSFNTWSISALLQLALSMDYSIILMDRYRQEQRLCSEPETAMIRAVKAASLSVFGSALTTAVGLAALIFMQFRIGADMGIVLAKGVLISMICVLTVLPHLILSFEKQLGRFAKKVPSFSMRLPARFSYAFRYGAAVLFALLLALTIYMKGETSISFTLSEPNDIDHLFPKSNQTLVICDNGDREHLTGIAAELSADPEAPVVLSWDTTLGAVYTAESLAGSLGSLGQTAGSLSSMLPASLTEEFASLAGLVPEDLRTDIENEGLSAGADLFEDERVTELAPLLTRLMWFDKFRVDDGPVSVSGMTLVSFIRDDLLTLSAAQSLAGKENIGRISSALALLGPLLGNTSYNGEQLYERLQALPSGLAEGTEYLSAPVCDLLCRLCAACRSEEEAGKSMSLKDLLDFLAAGFSEGGCYRAAADEAGAGEQLASALGKLSALGGTIESTLNSPQHTLLIVTSDLPDESEQTDAFFDRMDSRLAENLTRPYYRVGNTAMAREMASTFSGELGKITLITIISIFIVVLVTFRSIPIPVILVALIQTAVYATMVIIRLQGQSIYYLALLMVQSILMGATIDYAILFTNYYRELRKSRSIRDALQGAYQGSINTILTSGMVLILVTVVLGYAFPNPTIGQICHTIAKGTSCAVVLILLILPGTLAALDRYTAG